MTPTTVNGTSGVGDPTPEKTGTRDPILYDLTYNGGISLHIISKNI